MPHTTGPDGELIIENYKSTGYKVVVIASTFPNKGPYQPGVDTNWGAGALPWIVDYKPTSTIFWRLASTYNPVAVTSYSRDVGNNIWLLEIGVCNLANSSWTLLTFTDPPFTNTPPYVGGAKNDPAAAPGRPNNGAQIQSGQPPDATLPAYVPNTNTGTRDVPQSILDTLFPAIRSSINALPGDSVVAQNATVRMGINAGNKYVSAFMGYHSVWYAEWSSTCKVGFHTHVGFDIPLCQCMLAFDRQMAALIAWLNSNP